MKALDAIGRVIHAAAVVDMAEVDGGWGLHAQRLAILTAPASVGPGEQGYWCVAVQLSRQTGESVLTAAERLRQFVEVWTETYGVEPALSHVLEGDL